MCQPRVDIVGSFRHSPCHQHKHKHKEVVVIQGPSTGREAPVFLSRKALAARWLTSPGHLANLATRGEGPPFVKLGAKVLYRLDDVMAYESQRVISPIGRAA